MLLLFINTSPVNVLTVSCLPASMRATGTAMNVLLIHLLGDAISPEWVGRRADALGSSGEALATALQVVLPAICISGAALWFAQVRRVENP
jgi:hypothetical protein